LRVIIDCIPNFSTSDPKVVESMVNEIRRTENVFLLDYTFGDYYNMLVVSFIGNKESTLKAVFNTAFKAVELIDIQKHKGQHPCLGAVDVVPFIPIKNVTMDNCIELAGKFGET